MGAYKLQEFCKVTTYLENMGGHFAIVGLERIGISTKCGLNSLV